LPKFVPDGLSVSGIKKAIFNETDTYNFSLAFLSPLPLFRPEGGREKEPENENNG